MTDSRSARPATDFSLRRSLPEDHDFLLQLYISTRESDLQFLGEALLRMQYEMRASQYSLRFPQSVPDIILVNETEAGAVWIDHGSGDEAVLVDIALLPAYRNRGIGSALLKQYTAQCATAGRAFRLSVDKSNSDALRLYKRFGFRIVSESDMYLGLRRSPVP